MRFPRLFQIVTFQIVGFVCFAVTFFLLFVAGVSSMGDPGPGDSLEPPRIYYVCITLAAATALITVLAAAWGIWLKMSQRRTARGKVLEE
jgi:hypothetical protein